jgi:tRNA-splicing ligase RtcB
MGFNSCSHGSGRTMGRKQAKNTLSLENEKKLMEGVINRMTIDSLDEAPSAYKDIKSVMEDQNDLV